MTPTPPEFFTIRLKAFEPAWIGKNPFASGFAIGATDGALVFTDELGVESHTQKSPAKDAITGLAKFKEYLAISTGDEVSIVVVSQQAGNKTLCSTLPHGAHGIIATSNGYFIAPIGHDGLMVIKPSHDSNVNYRTNTFEEPLLNFYQLTEIPRFKGKNYCIAACRSLGVGLIDYSTISEMGLQLGTFETTDCVDVISLGNADYPYAIAAIGMRGEIWLCRDIIGQEPPIMLHYKNFAGKAYRILSGHGHLFILTSKAIYLLADLASRVVQPIFDKSMSPVMTIPMDAVDAAIIDDKWLLVAMPDSVRRYDLDVLDSRIAEFARIDIPTSSMLPFEQPTQNWTPRKLAVA